MTSPRLGEVKVASTKAVLAVLSEQAFRFLMIFIAVLGGGSSH